MILYGLKTCDTCRKALKAIEATARSVTFRDVRAEPLSPGDRARFLAAFGDKLVNRASTTWRGLSDADRSLPPETLLAAHPALMKRPVIADGERLFLGWSAATEAALLK